MRALATLHECTPPARQESLEALDRLALLPPAPFRFEGGLRGASFDLGLAPGVPCRPGVLIEPSPNGLIGSSYGTDVAWKGDAGLSRSTIANCSPKDRGLTMDGSVG